MGIVMEIAAYPHESVPFGEREVAAHEQFARREALLLCPTFLIRRCRVFTPNPKIGSRFSDRKHRAHGEHNESFVRILRIL